MKKAILLFGMLASSVAFGQFKLTPNNFVNEESQDKNYIVLEFPEMTQKQIFEKAKMYIHSTFKNLKGDGFNEVEYSQIKLRASQGVLEEKVFGLSGAIFDATNVYELNFKDGKMMVKPYFEYGNLRAKPAEKTYLTGGIGLLGKSIFKKDGTVWMEKQYKAIEDAVNNFVSELKAGISKSEDW